jgi:hypothetical protein
MFVLGSLDGYKVMISHFIRFSSKIYLLNTPWRLKPFSQCSKHIQKVYQELVHRFPDARITVMGDSGWWPSATLIKMPSEEKLPMPSGVALFTWLYLRGNTESAASSDPIRQKKS